MRATRFPARSLGLAVLPLLALGCGEKEPEHTGSTDDSAETPFAPEAGTYEVTSNETTADSCNFPVSDTADPDSGSDPFTLSAVDPDTRTFVIGLEVDGETVDLACTWDEDQSFSCEAAEIINIPLNELQIDAAIIGTSAVAGAFSDTATMTGTQTIEISCQGTQIEECASAADTYLGITLPCGITAEVAAALSAEGPG